MKNWLILVILLLSGCTLFHVHRIDIQQGNIITPQMVNRLHTGMTKAQVKELMGSPVLMNTFNDNRADYVYTFMPANMPMQEKYITLTFKGNVLREIRGNMYSQFIK